ncbi:cytochrome P450 71AP13-like [Primulina tabacum]|uniref:cytochrome P450 71AP13-like n=1 Tax=Primulina tabacum TaxID=48773 RepID=UPI003F5ACE1F
MRNDLQRVRCQLTESDITQMNYLKAVIKEIFRLHPPAPVLLPRESMEEVSVGGYTIPEKTRIYINAWAIGRSQESWKDPDIFDPERFMDNEIDFRGKDFELIPFGAGRRSCPAIAFGSATVELALAQLVHSFDWELPLGVQPADLDMSEVFGITMHRISPLMVVAKPIFKGI